MTKLALQTAATFDAVCEALRRTPGRIPGRGYLAALRDVLNAIGDALDQEKDPIEAVLAFIQKEAHPRGNNHRGRYRKQRRG